MKTCAECQIEKPLDSFSKDKHRPDGKRVYCKECITREYNIKQTEKRELKRIKKLELEQYYKDNPEEYDKILNNHKIRRQETLKKWAIKNIVKIREKNNIRHRKFLNDPIHKMIHRARVRTNEVLKGIARAGHTIEILGCTPSELKLHIESQFKDGMSWDNYGVHGWHVDHIIPCSSFDLTIPENQKKCFHYTNLQPLWWLDNLIKGNNIK